MEYKKIIRSTFFFLLGIYALNSFYKDFSLVELIEGIAKSKVHWILLATLIHLINHLLRALRWKALIGKQGAHIHLVYYVLAEMTGFFSNLFVPRLGEWTRCSSLKRMKGLPLKISFPTVIAERGIDLFVFIAVFCLVFIASFFSGKEVVQKLIIDCFQSIANSSFFSLKNMLLGIGILIIIGVAILVLYHRFKDYLWKYIDLLTQFFHAIKHALFNSNFAVWVPTLFVWISYFLVEYISCFALAETHALSFFAILSIFVVINMGAAVPVPGNIGAYHVLMYATLSTFGVSHEPAMIYVTLTHGIQVFNALVIGGICTIIGRCLKDERNLQKKKQMS